MSTDFKYKKVYFNRLNFSELMSGGGGNFESMSNHKILLFLN